MGKVISVVSGKGGVGKTTIACGLGVALATNDYSVCIIDLDVGLNNVDVLLGVESKVVFDLKDCLEGRCRIKQALVCDEKLENLYVMPSLRYGEKMCDFSRFDEIVVKLSTAFDFVIIDAPAGVGEFFEMAISNSGVSLVVVSPHVASIRDADKVVNKINACESEVRIVVNRIRGDMVASKMMLSHKQIEKLLKTQIVGVIPESDRINILSSVKFEKIANAEILGIFNLIIQNLVQNKKMIYDYESRYKGILGSIRRKIKRMV